MDPQRLTDAEAKRLLARASELDAERASSLDVDTVRAIAAEAGISPTAVEAALQESAMTKPPPDARSPGRSVLATTTRVVIVLGVVYVLVYVVLRMVS